MPNWVHNRMKVTGAADEIARFKQLCIVDGELKFDAVISTMLQEVRDDELKVSYACCSYFKQEEASCLECSFDTAWSPPVTVWKTMGEMFPTIEFELEACEPINDEAFRGTIRDGRLELHDEPLVWTTIDPKTGEEVSGTREEIDRVLGNSRGMVATSIKKDEEPSDDFPL
jgi:hypothetical protein